MAQLRHTYQQTRKSVVGLLPPRLRSSNLGSWLLALGLAILPLLPATPMLAAPTAAIAPSTPTGKVTNSQPIPIDQLGAMTDQQGTGTASHIQATARGAELQAPFQDLAGSLGADGLWLRSTGETTPAAPAFRVMATALGRLPGRARAFATTGTVQVEDEWARSATVTIANNDSNEGSYTFTIQGTGAQALTSSQLTQQAGYTQTCATATTPYVKQCTINFTLQNISGGTLQVKYYQLTTLSSHVDLLNGTPNPGGVGAQVTAPGSVASSATFPASFTLGLKSNTAYTIRYKVYGYAGAVMAAGTGDTQAVELGEYAVTLPAEDATSSQIFLPLVAQ